MVKLINIGKAANLGTAFAVMESGKRLGTAYRQDSGDKRGMYSFNDEMFSRERLIATFSTK